MFFKIVAFMTVLGLVLAQDPLGANFHENYNNNHNSVKQTAVAPAITKFAAISAPVYRVPTMPVVAKYAPLSASSYFSAPAPLYNTPVLSRGVANYAASSAAYTAPLSYAAPAPVAKYAASPVGKYASAPSYNQEGYAHPKYEYAYSIEDHHTGDLHSQQEQRDGDHVIGQYTLREADGTVRIVKYYDDGHGFNVVVEKQGTPTEAPVLFKKVVAPVAVNDFQ